MSVREAGHSSRALASEQSHVQEAAVQGPRQRTWGREMHQARGVRVQIVCVTDDPGADSPKGKRGKGAKAGPIAFLTKVMSANDFSAILPTPKYTNTERLQEP